MPTPVMPTSITSLVYVAQGPLLQAPTVWVGLPDGHPFAQLQHVRTAAGRDDWHWTGGGVPDFVIQDERQLESFLVTRPDGVPFGRLRRRGLLRPRLEVGDAHGPRLLVDDDGRLLDAFRTPLGRIEHVTPDRMRLEVPEDPTPTSRHHGPSVTVTGRADPTDRSLLLATPMCHLAQRMLLHR